jgi:hypothetical protein
MGKYLPDVTLDKELDYIALSDMQTVCAGSPITFTDCYSGTSGCMLASMLMTSGCFTIANDTSGRKLTVTAKTGTTISYSGTALAVALIDAAGSTVRAVTTCTSQALTAGGTVDCPSWVFNIQDPT